MLYKKLFLLFLLSTTVFSLLGQTPSKRYRWKHLGPHTTSKTNVDSSRWTAVGQGWIEDIIIEDDAWYAGSITGGLYKSKNKGKKWKKIDNDTVQMGTLCLLKSNGVLYRGTGVTHYGEHFGLGLLKSLDDGKTWSSTGLNFKPEEEKPLWDIDVSSDGTLAACTPNEVYISKDQGISWEIVYSGEKCDFRTVLFSSDGKTLLVSGNILLRSENLGENWTECTSVIEESIPEKYNKSIARIAICKDPNISNRFLAFYGVKNDGYIMESSDNGRTWHLYQKHKNIRRADVHHTEIAIAPDNSSVIVLGTYRTYLSTDNGETFETVTNPGHQSPQFAHDDIRGMYLKGPGEFYLATDGGVFMTIDTAKTWINVSGKGLSVMQIYGFTELEDGRFLMGCQDMSYFTLEKKEWTQLGSYYGDGGDAFETSKGQYILLGGRVKNIDISEIYKSTTIHPARTNPFIAKFYEYPNALDSFFYVGHDLWMFNGRRWNNLSNNISRGQHMIMGFDINESNPNQVFIAYDQPTWSGKRLSNKFYKSNDGGATWNDITSNLPILAWRHITSLSSNENNPNEIYVSLGKTDNKDIHKVYKSLDGGETWVNFSAGLPPFETFMIKQVPGTTGVVVASLSGLYYRNDGMESWVKLKGKIPPIAIRDFEINTETRRINAATYGNGFWQMKIPRKMLKL